MTGPILTSNTKTQPKNETEVGMNPSGVTCPYFQKPVSILSILHHKIDLLLLSVGLMATSSAFDIISERIREDYYQRTSVRLIFMIPTLLFPINWLIAKAILGLLNPRTPVKEDSTNRWWYICCALFNAAIIIYGITAKFVDSVASVLISAGPLALMFFVKQLNGKSYSLLKLLTVVPLVVGVAITYDGDVNRWEPSMFDIITFACLAMVGLFGAFLDCIRTPRSDGAAPTALQMMSSINGWGAVCVTTLFVFFEGFEFLHWTSKYPELLMDFTWLTVVGVLCQFFVYTMVSKYGALTCLMTTTACKVLTTLFDGPFVERQWVGLGVTATALIVDGALLTMQ